MKFLILITLLFLQASAVMAENARETPPIQEVFRVAIRSAGLEGSRVDRWRRRARRAPLLPRLQVEFDRNLRNQVNLNVEDSVAVNSSGVTIGPQSSSQELDADSDLSVGVKAVWYLDQLLYSRDDLEISSESRAMAQDRQQLLEQIRKIYFLREEKIKNRTSPVEVASLTAALDAYTDGWFSEEMEKP